MKKVFIILIEIILVGINLRGVPLLINENISASGTALAGAGVAKNYKSVDGISENPAALYGLKNKEIQAGWIGLPEGDIGLNYGYLLFGMPADKMMKLKGNIGGGIYLFNISSDMSIYDDIGNQIGTIKNSDYMIKIFYANKIRENFQYGISLKYFYSSLDDVGVSGVCIDIGGLYLTSLPALIKGISIPKHNTSVGLKIENIGFINQGYMGDGNLPIKITTGINYRWKWNSNLNKIAGLYIAIAYQELEYKNSGCFTESLGFEWELVKMFVIRAGYKFDNKYDSNGFSTGIGLNYRKERYSFKFNYGVNFNKFANIHLISFNMGF